MDNNDSKNDIYHEDNSFNNQGIITTENAPENKMQMPTQQKGGALNDSINFARGFKDGVQNGLNPNKKNPALGINKKNSNNQNKTKANNKKNPAKGQKDTTKKNPLPGGSTSDKNKNNNVSNNKNANDIKNNQNDNNKNGGIFSKLNNATRNIKKTGDLGNSAKAEGAEKDESKVGQLMKTGLKKLWTVAPIQVKAIIVIAIPSIIVLAILITVITMTLGGTVASAVVLMCNNDNGSTYNGEGYNGSADVKDFLCKMQSPFVGNYKITSYAGWRVHPVSGVRKYHEGMDFGIPSGTKIYAAQAGTVTHAGSEGGYGNSVVINHGSGFTTRYAHNSKVLVKKGDKVGKGQLIALSGSTGISTGPHLHFEVRKNNETQSALNERMEEPANYKKNCGSAWAGDLAGDSANATNDTTEYEYIGTGSEGEKCCVSDSSSSSEYCPNGITVTGNDAGTYSLDEYIERVVTAENGGAHDEALKALAIAARTYAINRTDNCKKTIPNSTAAQVMADEATDKVKKALSSVTGAVMLYNGKVFSAEYSSFWGTCNSNNCIGKFQKVPSDEWETYTMPKQYYTLTGHERGLSQNGSNYMASQGKKYDEILKFFYADDIEITNGGNTCALNGNSFNGKIWYYDQTDYQQPYGSYGTIATHGCGPTAMAIAVSSLLNEKHDPVELTNYACSNGYCSDGGTSHSFFEAAAKKYGLTVKKVSKDNANEVLIALNGGKSIVIAIMGPGKFTSGGHFITLTGSSGDQVFVHDPNNGDGKGYNKLWDFDLIKSETANNTNTPFWIISK